jgi:hypothetical protein
VGHFQRGKITFPLALGQNRNLLPLRNPPHRWSNLEIAGISHNYSNIDQLVDIQY